MGRKSLLPLTKDVWTLYSYWLYIRWLCTPIGQGKEESILIGYGSRGLCSHWLWRGGVDPNWLRMQGLCAPIGYGEEDSTLIG